MVRVNAFISVAVLLAIAFVAVESATVGSTVCFSAGLRLRNGACGGTILKVTTGTERGKVLAQKTVPASVCNLGAYNWIQVDLGASSGGKVWAAEVAGLIHGCGSAPPPSKPGSKVLNVPYVNQRWDTPDSFGGSWACGPTSAVMAMAYFGKIKPHPITCSSPSPHKNDYGWYVPNVYTSPTGVTFNRMQTDSNGRQAWGAWGTCTEGGGAWAWRIQEYAKGHGLAADFYDTATFSLVRSSIDAGSLVVLSTQLSSAGHLILVRGYNSDGSIVANDPWGNAALPGWPANGAGVRYTWAFAKTKWCVVIRKPKFAAELDNLPFPAPKDLVEFTSAHHTHGDPYTEDIEAFAKQDSS